MINTMEIPPEELPALDLFQNCRLCLAKEKVSVDIFSEGHEVRVLYYKIMSCLPVHVTQDDKLPRKICTQCNEKVDNFYQFWTLTAKTQKTLLDWSEKKDSLPAIKIKTENVAPPGEVSFKQETMDYSDDDNDRYDDDQSEDDLEPTAMVKVCEETDENPAAGGAGGAAGTSATTVKLSVPIDSYHFTPHFMSTILDQAGQPTGQPGSTPGQPGSTPGQPGSTLKQSDAKQSDAKQSDVKLYGCSTCDKKFKKREYLRAHIKHVHKAACRPFQCTKCPKTYKRKVHLDAHLLTHTDLRPFTCEFCEKNFKTKDALAIHQKHQHHGIKPKKKLSFACHLCPKAYTSRQRLGEHQYTHDRIKKFICDLCGSQQSTTGNLMAHIKRVHQPRPDIKFQCHLCGAEFRNKTSVSSHINFIHGDGKPKCHMCGKVVSNKQVLRDHINYHTGEKPYSCEYCSKSFASKSVLQTHVRQHTGETPFKCSICPKAFKQRSALTGHLKSNHAVELHR